MSGLKNSPFGKRLRASHQESDEDAIHAAAYSRRTRPRVNSLFAPLPINPALSNDAPTTAAAHALDSDAFDLPLHNPHRIQVKDYGDRFVPSRDAGDMRTSYHLKEEGGGPATPSKHRMIPTESDALKEQANAIFNSILQTEVTPLSARRSPSPSRRHHITSGAGITASSSSTSAIPPTTPTRRRLFAYNSPSASNPATPQRRLDTPTDEAYSMSPVRAESRQLLESPRRQPRSVCKTPYRVLDAPDLADDFYLNLVDWSSANVLGVGLGHCVYLWSAHNAHVSKLCDLGAHDPISSVSWAQQGASLAVGTTTGKCLIYDAQTLKLQRTYTNAHSQRIGALSWNGHILSSGSRDRVIYHRDTRDPTSRPFKKLVGHRQEVCGLKWSNSFGGVFDGGGGSGPNAGFSSTAMLASGGNDNKVCIWDLRGNRRVTGLGGGIRASPSRRNGEESTLVSSGGASGSENTDLQIPGDSPVFKFHEHTAAVKALAWDPHVSGVLATGGGTQDGHIRFWNTSTGTILKELGTGSQVCNLIWSLTSHELVSTHGFSHATAQNQICIWKYPSLNMVASLTGHLNRVLYLAMSPDGETIVTGAGDETLRFWNAFPRMAVARGRKHHSASSTTTPGGGGGGGGGYSSSSSSSSTTAINTMGGQDGKPPLFIGPGGGSADGAAGGGGAGAGGANDVGGVGADGAPVGRGRAARASFLNFGKLIR